MKWTHYVTLFLGLWLIAAPLSFGYSSDTHLASNDIICGILIIAFGIYSLTRLKVWAAWMLCLIGIWLQFAPLFFFAKEPAVYLNDTLIGSLLIGFAILIPRLPHEAEDKASDVPLGWSYNPSSWTQRLPVIGLACICWFLARYLAGFELGYYATVWDPFFHNGTKEVLTSKVSQSFPLPDAGLGAMAYTMEALLGCKGSEKRWRTMPWIVLSFGLLVIPVGIVSIILVMLQPIVVGAWCSICLLTALLMVVMVILTLDEVVASIQFLHFSVKKGHPFWHTFWKGGSVPNGPVCKQTLQEDCGFLGVSFVPSLFCAALVGITLICLPSYFALPEKTANIVHIIGALSTVIALIAQTEVARLGRYANMFLGALLILSLFFCEPVATRVEWTLVIAGIALILLSYKRGKIEEKYGSYQKYIA
ncbi:MAG: vitamin K epoxide reductase family protein [Chlamydiota bacterium]